MHPELVAKLGSSVECDACFRRLTIFEEIQERPAAQGMECAPGNHLTLRIGLQQPYIPAEFFGISQRVSYVNPISINAVLIVSNTSVCNAVFRLCH